MRPPNFEQRPKIEAKVPQVLHPPVSQALPDPCYRSAGSCKFPMDPHTQVLDTDTGRVPTIGLAGIGRHKSAGPGTRSQHVFTTLVNPVPFLPCLTSVLEPHLLQVFLKMRSVGCKTCHTHCQSRLAKSAMNARRLKGAPIP